MTELDDLIGCEVSGVNFVRDYFELHFDGPVLRVMGDFSIESGQQKFLETTEHWRETLCGLIGHSVQKIDFQDETDCAIYFTEDIALKIHLVPSVKSGPETMHFMPWPNKSMRVW